MINSTFAEYPFFVNPYENILDSIQLNLDKIIFRLTVQHKWAKFTLVRFRPICVVPFVPSNFPKTFHLHFAKTFNVHTKHKNIQTYTPPHTNIKQPRFEYDQENIYHRKPTNRTSNTTLLYTTIWIQNKARMFLYLYVYVYYISSMYTICRNRYIGGCPSPYHVIARGVERQPCLLYLYVLWVFVWISA